MNDDLFKAMSDMTKPENVLKPKTRFRILFPRPGDTRGITHWVYAADQKHKPIAYAASHFAFYKDGRKVEGYQLHNEF